MNAVRPFQHQPELRALMILPTIPANHLTIRVEGDDFDPHLRDGEFAVVDLADREPVLGEIFVVGYQRAGSADNLMLRFCMPIIKQGVWWLRAQLPVPPLAFQEALQSGRMRTLDGPYDDDLVHLRSMLIGRVVGVYHARRGGPLS